MSKGCPGGKWDYLLNECLSSTPEPDPPTELPLAVVVQLRSTSPTVHAHSVTLPSPALWIFVVATVGSIMALALWFIIYKRQSRLSSTSEDAEVQQEQFQKTEQSAKIHPPPSERDGQADVVQGAAWAPSSCLHLHLGAQTGTTWEEGFSACRESANDAGTEGGSGLPPCSRMRQHKIPLPATELGGTALVTTKTV